MRVSNCSRKSLLNNGQKRKIVMEIKKYPFMSANQLKISENLGGIVSVDTFKRVIRENCLFGSVSTNKPNLSVRQIKFCSMWCKSCQK